MSIIRSGDVEPRDDLDNVAKEIVDEIEKRLDERMPDEIGVVWPAISKIVLDAAHTGVCRSMQRAAELVIEGAMDDAERKLRDDPLRWSELAIDGRELADELNDEKTLERQLFFRDFVSRLDPQALADLTVEVIRQ